MQMKNERVIYYKDELLKFMTDNIKNLAKKHSTEDICKIIL